MKPDATLGLETTSALILAAVCASAGAVFAGAQEATALERGAAIQRDLSGGDEHHYRITLNRGDYARVLVEQRGIDVQIEMLETDGTVIASDSEYRTGGDERLEVVAGADASYAVTVTASRKMAATGQYEIRVVELRAASPDERLLHEARTLEARFYRALTDGRYDDGRRFAERAVAIAEQVLGPHHPFVARLLLHVAYYYSQKEDFAAAIALYDRAIAISESTLGAEHPQTINLSRALAFTYLQANENARAERLAQRALDASEKVLGPDHYLVARCLLSLAQVVVDFRKSEQLLQRALTIAELTVGPDHNLTANVLNELGIRYMDRQEYQKAEDFLLRSQAAYPKSQGSENLNHQVGLFNLGRIAREKKDYAKAEEYYRRSIAIVERAFGADNPRLAPILNNIATLYRARGDYAKSLEAHVHVLRISEATRGPDHPLTLTSLGNIARTYAAQGDLAQAVHFQSRVDAVIERNIDVNLAIGSEREKLAYLRSVAERTDRTISLNVQLAPHDPDAAALAALVLLQRKGRVLDAMSESFESLRQRSSGEARTLIERYSETTARLARLVLGGPRSMSFADHHKTVSDLGDEKERLEADISRLASEFRAQSRPVTLAAVQAMIPAHAALIEFAVYRPFDPKAESNTQAYGAPRYSAHVIRASGAVGWRDLGPSRDIDAAIGALRQALRDPHEPGVQAAARTVDETIMRPVREIAGTATHLLVSPDGALNLVPFEALVDERGRYLVERYAFTYLTTGRDLLRMQVTRASRSAPLIVANPAFGETAAAEQSGGPLKAPARRRSVTIAGSRSEMYFAPLGATALEARTIRLLYPDARSLTGTQATESAIKQAAAPRILHIATHGFFLRSAQAGDGRPAAARPDGATDNPLLRSGLALARANLRGDGGDDGILTALEATGLNLWGTRLVVLSACDTGLGEVRNGEGVYGLRRSFVLAGAESLLMSLWPVSDYSTRRLMSAYYKNLKLGHPRGAALRRVQLEMLKADPRLHPFYWANFIQSGDWTSF